MSRQHAQRGLKLVLGLETPKQFDIVEARNNSKWH